MTSAIVCIFMKNSHADSVSDRTFVIYQCCCQKCVVCDRFFFPRHNLFKIIELQRNKNANDGKIYTRTSIYIVGDFFFVLKPAAHFPQSDVMIVKIHYHLFSLWISVWEECCLFDICNVVTLILCWHPRHVYPKIQIKFTNKFFFFSPQIHSFWNISFRAAFCFVYNKYCLSNSILLNAVYVKGNLREFQLLSDEIIPNDEIKKSYKNCKTQILFRMHCILYKIRRK